MKSFDIYINTEEGVTEDGGTLVRADGCNGEFHAIWYVVEYQNETTGVVDYADSLVTVIRGRCDGTCKNNHGKLGFFGYDPKPIEAMLWSNNNDPR